MPAHISFNGNTRNILKRLKYFFIIILEKCVKLNKRMREDKTLRREIIICVEKISLASQIHNVIQDTSIQRVLWPTPIFSFFILYIGLHV